MIDRTTLILGVNMRLQPLQAIVALDNLRKLNKVIKKEMKTQK